jgi:hypothetical protein
MLSIIMLDKAVLHLVLGPDVPVCNKLKKEKAKDFLENGIPFDLNITAVKLKQLAKMYIKENLNVMLFTLQKKKDTMFYSCLLT